MKLRCLIIDDEPVARKGLEEYVKEIDFLLLVAKCENTARALPFIREGMIDLLFLDIQMPNISGIDFLKKLSHPPMVIFITAHPEYALEGYSLDVIDYLLKPVVYDRFLKSAQKARDYYELTHHLKEQIAPPDYFFVKCDSKYEKILFGEVTYVEAMQNYVVIHTVSRRYITYITLSGLESQLPKDRFLKVHKSFIVAVSKITIIDGNDLVVNSIRVPISRTLKQAVMDLVVKNNLLKR